MLIHLLIRNIVLVESLDIDFSSGLCVLSGETGSGKSVLLDAISLALGGRGDGGLVRRGTEKGQVSAIFDIPENHSLGVLLCEANIHHEGNVVFRRVQFSDGRTKAYINDQLVSVGFMRTAGCLLVENHSQHADRALIDVSGHRNILDSYAGIDEDLHNLGVLYRNWRQSVDALQEYKTKKTISSQEIEFLRFSIQELQSINIQPGEETVLAEKRSRMLKQERIASDLAGAFEELNGSASPISVVSSMLRRIERKSSELPGFLDSCVTSLNEAFENLSNAQQAMEKALSEIEYDSGELESIEERLFALRAVSRKYSVPVEDLPDLEKKMVSDLDDIQAGSEKLVSFEKILSEAREAYDIAAQDISSKRRQVARSLEKNIMVELPALKLENVIFMVKIISDSEEVSFRGIDKVEFYVQTNSGENAGPLMKLASGGELSRLLLALKIVLVDRGSAPTLIFDEVDSGVGGAVADAIGYRLKQLSEKAQVLVITHAPQVAARADTHLLIYKQNKSEDRDRMVTHVLALTKKERCEEIARMLAGRHITNEARAAATRLLELNQQ
ncbi:DNA repair protein RecN [Candidatus Liberibacter sp.]|uniref:DNA repair protein RecN n=1 Tax=Candidatus Liberibacter sp. TaxID=34022 RepID=UPI0015F6B8CA|nr:DNA repair protein RecN [Candidatus Liberibacter sp.]MBA5724293.1 DNA repair protein RecN [Candidatus Liberibacter sp.]